MLEQTTVDKQQRHTLEVLRQPPDRPTRVLVIAIIIISQIQGSKGTSSPPVSASDTRLTVLNVITPGALRVLSKVGGGVGSSPKHLLCVQNV
jgi:hypothetical protein